jgi:hypothetical protein
MHSRRATFSFRVAMSTAIPEIAHKSVVPEGHARSSPLTVEREIEIAGSPAFVVSKFKTDAVATAGRRRVAKICMLEQGDGKRR